MINLNPLSSLENIKSLDIYIENGAIEDLTPLVKLKKLTSVTIKGFTFPKDLKPLTEIESLEELDLSSTVSPHNVEVLSQYIIVDS